jgi:hypothetical protein
MCCKLGEGGRFKPRSDCGRFLFYPVDEAAGPEATQRRRLTAGDVLTEAAHPEVCLASGACSVIDYFVMEKRLAGWCQRGIAYLDTGWHVFRMAYD